jgi:hypothetical protein
MILQAEYVLGLGDTHSIRKAHKRVRKAPEDSIIIQVGDFGVGFDPKRDYRDLGYLVGHLKRHDKALIVLRGNHDNPDCFHPDHRYNKIDQRLMLVPDYTQAIINGMSCMFIGGAISIDRSDRVPYKDWWAGEELQEDLSRAKPSEVLFTHTAPLGVFPYVLKENVEFWAGEENKRKYAPPGSLKRELTSERKAMQRIVEAVQPKRHYYGNFHQHNMEEVNGVFCRCLGIGELVQLPI